MATLYVDDDYVVDGYVQTGITVDWDTGEIFVPKSETTLVQSSPIEVRELSITDFHNTLRDLEDDEEGMVFPFTHNYVASINVGGVGLAQVMEIVAPYTVTFEDGQWAVNLTGGNSNIADKVNINNVGVRTANSAGLVNNQVGLTLDEFIALK